MNPNTVASGVELDDPQLKAIGKRVLNTVRLAGEKAVASTVDAKHFPLADGPSDLPGVPRCLRGRRRPLCTARALVPALNRASRARKATRMCNTPRLMGFVVTLLTVGVTLAPAAAEAQALSYDALIKSDTPAMFLPMSSPGSGRESDLTGRGHVGTYYPAGSHPSTSVLPNGDPVARFNGTTQYLQVPDANDLSVTSRGRLTIEAWIRPDTLQFPSEEGTGYVHLLGKGEPNQHEYVARMYSKINEEQRPNRISGYAFNPTGHFGSGSYFQDPVATGKWILVDIVINTYNTSSAYPTGYVRIFKNGVLRDTTGLDQYEVVPRNGTAPFRVGTRDLGSFFKGPIGKVAIYLHELTPERIGSHYRAMVG